jgi:hypothetical protein
MSATIFAHGENNMRKLVIAGALAIIVAAPAFAQTYEPAANPSSPDAVRRGDQHGVGQPDAVMKGRQMIGRDPDSWIRNEILRHSDSGWPD